MLQSVEIPKLALHIRELFFQSALRRRARVQAIPPQPQEPSNLLEFETKSLHAPDEGQRF